MTFDEMGDICSALKRHPGALSCIAARAADGCEESQVPLPHCQTDLTTSLNTAASHATYLVDQNSASWNRLTRWLRDIDAVRLDASGIGLQLR